MYLSKKLCCTGSYLYPSGFSPLPTSVRIALPLSSWVTSLTVRSQISCARAPLEYITHRRTRSLQPSFSVVSGRENRISNSLRVKEQRCFPFTLRNVFLVNLLEAVLKNITSFQISAFRIICKRSERSQTLFCRCPAVFPRGYQPVKIFCQQFKIQCLKCDMPDLDVSFFIQILKQQSECTFIRSNSIRTCIHGNRKILRKEPPKQGDKFILESFFFIRHLHIRD